MTGVHLSKSDLNNEKVHWRKGGRGEHDAKFPSILDST